MKKTLGIAVVTLFGLGGLWAAVGAPSPVLIQGETAAPVIDGRLDDAVWQTAVPYRDFRTFKPRFGEEVSEGTDMYMAYDAQNLYFAFRCRDSDPGKIRATLAKRDNIDDEDYVAVILDMTNTRQGAYMFGVNPRGVQMDTMLNADGNGNGNYDAVWVCQGALTAEGYQVEIAIPLQSIRFPDGEAITIGLQGCRAIARKSEQAISPEFKPDNGSILGQNHQVVLRNLKAKRALEVLPAMTMAQHSLRQDGNMDHGILKGDLSLTGKVGLTSNLTLEGTINPDFSQVESDAGQIDVNLRTALYYSERRAFFLEGLDDFNFASAQEASPLTSVVHTRNIVAPLMGMKLTGKLGSRNTLSAIFSVDDYQQPVSGEEGEDAEDGGKAYVTIVRYKRALKGDSFLGGFLTSREQAGGFNRVAGADLRLRLNRTSIMEGMALGSFSGGGDHDGNGSYLSLHYNHGSEKWNIDFGIHDVSRGFRTDLGYITRTGVTMVPFFIMRTIPLKKGLIQRIEPFYWSYHTYDKASDLFETVNLFVLRFWLPGQTQVRFEGVVGNEVFLGQRFDIGFARFRANTQLTKQIYANFQFTRGSKIRYIDDPYQGYGNSLSATLRYQPGPQFTSILSLTFADFFRTLTRVKDFDYTILRSRNEFQFNRYLSLRAIVEYNTYRKRLATDCLAAFTYIPGTVIYLGYGGFYEKTRWEDGEYVPDQRLQEMERGFFFKASYLWRL
jgi:hypothetical protein